MYRQHFKGLFQPTCLNAPSLSWHLLLPLPTPIKRWHMEGMLVEADSLGNGATAILMFAILVKYKTENPCPCLYCNQSPSFSDVNECKDKSLYSCPSNSHCVNKVGMYECHCNKGYRRDKGQCIGKQVSAR